MDSFLDKLRISITNGEKLKIFHAGMDIEENSLKIRNMEIYNHLNINLSQPLITYLNNNDHSESHKIELLYVIFNLLYRENNNLTISSFLNKLSGKFVELIDFSSKISEDDIIELKSRDFLANRNEKTNVSRLGEDINKMESSKFKFYILGYDERIKEYEPFPSHRFDDSRISKLTNRLREYTNFDNIDILKIDYDSNQCILFLVVKI